MPKGLTTEPRACTQCGKSIALPRPINRTRCDACRTCSADGCARLARANGLCPKHYPERACLWCEATFRPVTADHTFCSSQCVYRFQHAKHSTLIRHCGQCSKEFRSRPQDNRIYCSKRCGYDALLGTRRPQNPDAVTEARRLASDGLSAAEIARTLGVNRHTPNRWVGTSQRTYQCAYCAASFTSKTKRLYCTSKCTARDRSLRRIYPIEYKNCRACAQLFVDSPAKRGRTRVYCSERCQLRVGSLNYAHKKRSAIKVGENLSILEIATRDKWRCQLCRKPVSKTKRFPHPQAPVLDHITPLSLGGQHVRSNVHLAHYACNSRKGNRAMNEQLMLFG
jgi:transposase-like protein